MTLTSEYQYVGRSNAVKDQNSQYSYYILLYAKTVGDVTTGRHTVSVKMLLASEMNTFYGYSTSGSILINGTTVNSWSWTADAPGSAWNHSNLTAGGVTYKHAVDLREVSLAVDVGYGAAKDIPIAASWVFNSGSAGYLPQKSVAANVSVSVTLPMIAGASVPTVSAASVDMGSELTIYTNRIAGAGLTHTVSWRFGSASGTIGTGVEDSCAWTPALDLAKQIPNAVSDTAVISCTTYAGSTIIGTKEVPVVLTVPESMTPYASADWSDPTGAKDTMGVLVQGISRLTVTPIGSGSYGSTITGSSVTWDGKPCSGGILTESGSHTLGITVTDSRGRVGVNSYTFTVAVYRPPSLTLNASRCLSDGTADEAGDHARITVSGFVTQVNSKNSASLTVSWGGSSERVENLVGNVSWQKIVEADVNATMAIAADLTDKLASVQRAMTLSTGYATADFLAGGKGIAFGKAATREGFECAMQAFFTGGVSGITADMVGAVSADQVQALATRSLSAPKSSSVKFRIAANLLLFGKQTSTVYNSVAVYALSGYSEYRAPAVTQLSAGTDVVVSTGGDNTNGWYIQVDNNSSNQPLNLFLVGNCVPTFI